MSEARGIPSFPLLTVFTARCRLALPTYTSGAASIDSETDLARHGTQPQRRAFTMADTWLRSARD